MVFCTECGNENVNDAKYCSECGQTLIEGKTKEDVKSTNLDYGEKKNFESKRNDWVKRIVTICVIWGFINLVVASPIFGGALIFFAILIYASKSFKAIYAFGVVWLLLALLQLVLGVYYTGYVFYANQGYLLILLSFINFGFGGWAIYTTRRLEEEGILPDVSFAITQIRCPECNEKVEKKDEYCQHCGGKLLWNWKD